MLRNRTLDISTVTDATAEPVTLAEAKAALTIDFPDHDLFITGLIKAARQLLELQLNITIAPKVLKVLFSCDGCYEYRIPYGPVKDITDVTFTYEAGEGVTISNTNYKLIGTDFKLFKGQEGYYTITYNAGYNPAPEAIKQGILKQVAWMYENRGDKSTDGQVNRDVLLMLSGYNKNAWI